MAVKYSVPSPLGSVFTADQQGVLPLQGFQLLVEGGSIHGQRQLSHFWKFDAHVKRKVQKKMSSK
jgi:hypothetical protein